MPSEAAVSTFLDELFDAAIFPQRWPDAVAGFRNLLNEDVGNVITHLTVIDTAAGETVVQFNTNANLTIESLETA